MAEINGTPKDDVLDNTVGEDDTIDGGAGNDTVSYVGAGGGAGVLIELSGQAFDLGNSDSDMLISIENVIGSSFDDVITGDENANVLDGAGGNDLLSGGGGTDTASYASASMQGAAVDLGAGTASDGSGGNDVLFEIENLLGSDFGDSLTGDGSGNTIDGSGGDDALRGAGGADELTGGAGADVFHYSFEVAPGGESDKFTFTDYFLANGGTVVNGEVDDGTKQGQFSSLYTQWLEMLVTEHGLGTRVLDIGQNAGCGGTPVIENMTGEFGERESFTWTSGSGKKAVVHERWYSDTWSSGSGGDKVTSADGLDTILDFGSGDKLGFSGLSREQFLANFSANFSTSAAGDAALEDTVITINGYEGWSLTLADVTLGLTAVADSTIFS
jgi:hypothetical protein